MSIKHGLTKKKGKCTNLNSLIKHVSGAWTLLSQSWNGTEILCHQKLNRLNVSWDLHLQTAFIRSFSEEPTKSLIKITRQIQLLQVWLIEIWTYPSLYITIWLYIHPAMRHPHRNPAFPWRITWCTWSHGSVGARVSLRESSDHMSYTPRETNYK